VGMKILAFTDFHGNENAYREATERIRNQQPDFVVVAGDIINHDANRAKQLLSELGNTGRPVYFVPGNMDGEELGSWPGEGNVRPLHGRGESLEGYFAMGLGGSPHGPFRTVFEYSEEEAATLLEAAARNYRRGQLILVSHCPPKNTNLDQVTSGEHVGSTSVRSFIEEKKPSLVVSGHVHEAQGIDKIGTTTLVNTGPAQRGNYANITIESRITVKFERLF
jgi:Icc-related predicted phosphoesterase